MPVYTSIYILFNSPSSSGKTTCAPELARELRKQLADDQVAQDSFAAPMKHFVAVAMAAQYGDMNKERAEAVLNGYSVREFLIGLSERYMKPEFGDDIFARLLHHRILRRDPQPRFVVVDDCGFDSEVDSVPRPFVVRVNRPGTSFAGDSRNYVSRDPDWVIDNNGSLDELRTKITKLASHLVLNVK